MTDPRKAYEQSQALEPDQSTDEDTGRPEAPATDDNGAAVSAGTEEADATRPPTFNDPTTEGVTGAGEQPGQGAGDDGLRAAEAVRGPADESEALRVALAEAERQRDEYLDHLRRERAEFDNFRKRNARERLEAMDRGVQSLMTELLGVLDNFGHVLAAADDSEDQALAKGAGMVHDELVGVLERFGLEEVPGEGSAFDPQWHEAMMQVAAEEDTEEPTVAQVLRSGYRFKGRVLRPASVSVAQ